jgi:hypothetical protein
MTKLDFFYLCGEASVDPKIALESESVRTILKKDRDVNSVDNQVEMLEILETEF